MAPPANKRQKVQHELSNKTDSDNASFASFGDSENEDDDSSDEEVENNHRKSVTKDAAALQNRVADQKKAATATTDAVAGAYSAGTFKSNMFKLQVDELLQQLRPRRGKREEDAEQALHKLKKTIEQIASRAPVPIADAQRQLLMSSKVTVPFPNPAPPKDAMYKLEYAKPAKINVVGSYALKISSRANEILQVDMAVTMPSAIFQEKDYLNHRYFYKRAYYLACIAASIKGENGKDFTLRYESFQGDLLRPILVISPVQPTSKSGESVPIPKWRINVIPCINQDVFSKEKLANDKNCVRSASDEKSAAQLTPFYNSALRADMLVGAYLKLLHSTSTSCSAFRDACLLGSTWLRQRGFGSSVSSGGFGNFEWFASVALLLQGGGPNGKPILSQGYSSYQLFKATLQLLAMKDFSKHALIIGSNDAVKPLGNGTPMLWDDARGLNLLFKVSSWSYHLLRQDARKTLAVLGDQNFDGFDAAFILRSNNPQLRFDRVVEVAASAVVGSEIQDDHLNTQRYQKLYDVLKQGLGDRSTQICLFLPQPDRWNLGSARANGASKGNVVIGINTNPDTTNRTVDHGPSAESKAEAAAFRKFWGEKSELRRFKDGSILESLIWAPNDSGQTVLEQVIRHVIQKHFSEQAESSLKFSGDGFAKLMKDNSNAAFQPIMDAYKQMETDIRSLDDLPLSLRQLMPADPQLRHASVNVPSGITQQRIPANVTLQFEGSARWPDDLVAIQRTKIAFLLKVSELLQESVDNVTARIGLENEDQEILNQAFLDVIYDSGPAFRIRIHHDREQTLLERQLKDKSLSGSAKETAALGLATYKRDYIKAPAHTQAVARLCSRFPTLSGTMRLTKKWFASHLLANHIADEIIELIVIRTFLQPWPWAAPSSVHAGFLRTLHWLSRWDWKADPLIVDLSASGELKQPDIHAIRTRFEAWRKLDPSLNRITLFAASNADTDGTAWTDGRPAKVVCGRMTALARSASAEVEEKRLELEAASLFNSPLTDFNFVLHLDPTVAGGKKRKNSKSNSMFKNIELEALTDASLVGLDPVRSFLVDLEKLYGSSILFFAGKGERPVIAGLWSPQTARRAWKANLNYSTMPLKFPDIEDVQAEVNKEAILKEIARLGGDMIDKVEVN
ncbi:Nrap protein [Acrodontium crateriforme]|uniref:U3 small nucleolar RNA-associated protein 22 n=1 Tax=Acrodontium crateriforme TaxID=150365 RepID=A0AAQ3R6M1_9PEZI|nr:Nrap protein [Acrodontium crateriforme]